MALRTITLRGFKSIASLENFEMRNINLLIGANGSGKSNFLSAFKFLAEIAHGNLQGYVANKGADTLLHCGRKRTSEIVVETIFNPVYKSALTGSEIYNGYRISLAPSDSDTLRFLKEESYVAGDFTERWRTWGQGNHLESEIQFAPGPEAAYVRERLMSYRQYHFHDTGEESRVKSRHEKLADHTLKSDAENLAEFLRRIRKKHIVAYKSIVKTIQMAAPFFGDFVDFGDEDDLVRLRWYELGDHERQYNAHALSDGTLRFICLTTLLLQPSELLPDTIIIDEPELGLHPYAISLLAEMIKQVAETKQVVIATQSVELLNHFAPEDVVVADREGPATVLRRLNSDDLSEWLKSYSLGELWQKNVLGGRPV